MMYFFDKLHVSWLVTCLPVTHLTPLATPECTHWVQAAVGGPEAAHLARVALGLPSPRSLHLAIASSALPLPPLLPNLFSSRIGACDLELIIMEALQHVVVRHSFSNFLFVFPMVFPVFCRSFSVCCIARTDCCIVMRYTVVFLFIGTVFVNWFWCTTYCSWTWEVKVDQCFRRPLLRQWVSECRFLAIYRLQGHVSHVHKVYLHCFCT